MDAEGSTPQTGLKNPGRFKAGTGFMVGGIMFMLLTNLLEAAVPGFSVRNDAISTLGGNGYPVELLWNTQLFVVGILWLFSTYLLFRGKGHRLMAFSFYLTGIGILLVSLDPWNVRGTLHGIGAQMGFLFGAISAITSPRILDGRLRILGPAMGALAIFAVICGALGTTLGLGGGGLERLVYYPIFLWEIAFGSYLLSKDPITW
ncbi:MAG: DUF998 domain-containing protein [Candidatus Thermoplasmatota archaeon]|jgi:hypothetical membrane protein|nr:DUF998 domain-containing protein [Candidatus Thermoplasmatota archaeon]MCL5987484.1 DUF998 domain-containing protein [Candidatus Thermoplasmatota archaeon]